MSHYGYADALSQGTSFNARVKNFNDGVILHNEQVREKFKNDTQQKKMIFQQIKGKKKKM